MTLLASSTAVVTDRVLEVSQNLLLILASFLFIPLVFLIIDFGWRELRRAMTDQSYSIGGFYLRRTPYAGYHRFRSKRWNMEHMP